MVEVPRYDASGVQVGMVGLPAEVFGAHVRPQLVAEHLLRQLAHRRKAHANTKDRSEIRGGGRKPWRQKGTGRARAGSIRSPLWAGGAVAMGPRGEASFVKGMPRKARRGALRSLLTDKARRGQLVVMAAPPLEKPRTREVVRILEAMGCSDRRVLFILPERQDNLEKSVRNMRNAKALLCTNLNPHDLLHFERVVLLEGAVERVTEVLR